MTKRILLGALAGIVIGAVVGGSIGLVLGGAEGMRSGGFARLELPAGKATATNPWVPRSALVQRGGEQHHPQPALLVVVGGLQQRGRLARVHRRVAEMQLAHGPLPRARDRSLT